MRELITEQELEEKRQLLASPRERVAAALETSRKQRILDEDNLEDNLRLLREDVAEWLNGGLGWLGCVC